MSAARHLFIVAVALAVPIAACGSRIAEGEPAEAETQSSASTVTPTATASNTATAAYPCLSNTTAYYSDAGPPPAEGGCRELYTPSERQPAGCKMTIVAPAGPSGCLTAECICSTSGRWIGVGAPPAHACPNP